MSHDWPQYKLRIPPELKALIESSAKDSNRSLNAEIISRLETSLQSEKPADQPLTAAEAKAVAIKARADTKSSLWAKCLEEISAKARIGATELFIDIDDYDNQDWNEDSSIYKEIFLPITDRLVELGYDVVIRDEYFHIKF